MEPHKRQHFWRNLRLAGGDCFHAQTRRMRTRGACLEHLKWAVSVRILRKNDTQQGTPPSQETARDTLGLALDSGRLRTSQTNNPESKGNPPKSVRSHWFGMALKTDSFRRRDSMVSQALIQVNLVDFHGSSVSRGSSTKVRPQVRGVTLEPSR